MKDHLLENKYPLNIEKFRKMKLLGWIVRHFFLQVSEKCWNLVPFVKILQNWSILYLLKTKFELIHFVQKLKSSIFWIEPQSI